MALKRQYPPHNLSSFDSVKKSEGRGHNLEHQQSLAANSDLQVVPFLPYDIVESILPRLPVRSLVRFRCVCRHWLSLIDDPKFIMLHHKIAKDKPRVLLHKFVIVPTGTIKYYELGSTAGGQHVNDADEAVLQESSFQVSIKDNTVRNNVLTRWRLSNSMHGLVCVFVETKANNDVYLMNPTTQEIAKLPERPLQAYFGISSFLLGFNSKRGEYMVAWMYSNLLSKCTRWDVLMLGRSPFGRSEEPAAKWKYAGKVGAEIWDHGETIHVDGMFYWLSLPGCADKFFTVDARGEDVKFEAKLAPPFIDDGEYTYYRLEEMGGRLCSLKITCENQKMIEIWRLEDHDRWAWSKVYSINWMEIHDPSYDIVLVEPLGIVGLIAGENKLLFTLHIQREDPSNCYVEPFYCYDLLAKTFSKYSGDVSLVLQLSSRREPSLANQSASRMVLGKNGKQSRVLELWGVFQNLFVNLGL